MANHRDHPRIRGEHVDRGDHPSVSAGSSPHTRGALAGLGVRGNAAVGSSPHTRGAPPYESRAADPHRIIPAYAGSTLIMGLAAVGVQDHPRIRGEHILHQIRLQMTEGSSPHTRGALLDGDDSYRAVLDHPRIRGEHVASLARAGSVSGSSPHTRGALRRLPAARQTSRIIPAYAGSTCSKVQKSQINPDHPRIRGEHSRPSRRPRQREGSSPHTRGARRGLRRWRRGMGIIPAYAGSTRRRGAGSPRPGDHPRIRGEHSTRVFLNMFHAGSSPHTRGARLRDCSLLQLRRIIPAYAGSTP